MVLHEFGHGLGFLSLTDPTTGDFEQNEPDIWSYFLYDEGSGKHWNELDAAGRKASAVSGALAWDGPSVKAAVPSHPGLSAGGPGDLRAADPGGGEGLHPGRVAQFSGQITATPASRDRSGVGSTGCGCTGQGRLAAARREDRHPRPGWADTRRGLHLRGEGAERPGRRARSACSSPTTPRAHSRPAGTAPDVVIPVADDDPGGRARPSRARSMPGR